MNVLTSEGRLDAPVFCQMIILDLAVRREKGNSHHKKSQRLGIRTEAVQPICRPIQKYVSTSTDVVFLNVIYQLVFSRKCLTYSDMVMGRRGRVCTCRKGGSWSRDARYLEMGVSGVR